MNDNCIILVFVCLPARISLHIPEALVVSIINLRNPTEMAGGEKGNVTVLDFCLRFVQFVLVIVNIIVTVRECKF